MARATPADVPAIVNGLHPNVSAILLVRHGQASFGASNYDQLSELGQRQSVLLGRALAVQQIEPVYVAAGRMQRHAQTAEVAMTTAGWDRSLSILPSWDEFDHEALVHAISDAHGAEPSTYQETLELAMSRWASGEHDADYAETFEAFARRVHEGLVGLVGRLQRGETGLVFTSGGAISWAVASLLGGGVPQWATLNRVAINTGITRLVTGSRGVSVVSFNEYGHLQPHLHSYR